MSRLIVFHFPKPIEGITTFTSSVPTNWLPAMQEVNNLFRQATVLGPGNWIRRERLGKDDLGNVYEHWDWVMN